MKDTKKNASCLNFFTFFGTGDRCTFSILEKFGQAGFLILTVLEFVSHLSKTRKDALKLKNKGRKKI